MFRPIVHVNALLGSLLMASNCSSAEYCISCSAPVATYRCIPSNQTVLKSLDVDPKTVGSLCAKVLQKLEKHAHCEWQQSKSMTSCQGPVKVVGLDDLERAFGGNDRTTTRIPSLAERISKGIGEAGRTAEEKARNTGVEFQRYWHCMTSLFSECHQSQDSRN